MGQGSQFLEDEWTGGDGDDIGCSNFSPSQFHILPLQDVCIIMVSSMLQLEDFYDAIGQVLSLILCCTSSQLCIALNDYY